MSWWTKRNISTGGGKGSDISYRDLALQFATAGQSTGIIQAEKEAERQRQLERANKRRLAEIEGQVGRLGELYGIGNSAAALENRNRINQAVENVGKSTWETGNRSIDRGFATETRGLRMSMAERGLSGGSIDASAQSRALATRSEQRQQVVLASEQAKTNLLESLRTRRLAAEAALRAGGQAGLDQMSLAQQQQFQIQQARGDVIPSNVGAGFSTAGQLYLYNQQARAAGGQGYDWGAWGGGNGQQTSTQQNGQTVNRNRTRTTA